MSEMMMRAALERVRRGNGYEYTLPKDVAALVSAALSVSDGSPKGQDAQQPDPSGRQRDGEAGTPFPLSSLALGGEEKRPYTRADYDAAPVDGWRYANPASLKKEEGR